MSLIYDAPSILFGEASSEPLPDPAPGEVVIRVGAWSLKGLRSCKTVVGHNLMWDKRWYDEYPWSREQLTPGVYRVRIAIPGSNLKTFAEQQTLLLPGEEIAPVSLAATVLLCHLKETGDNLLKNDWCRSAEVLPDGGRVAHGVSGGRVFVDYYWADDRDGRLWLAGCRKC